MRGIEQSRQVLVTPADAHPPSHAGLLRGTPVPKQCFKSIGLYEYRFADGHFSAEYGVFSVFAIFMLFYIGFAGGLLGFHSYLLAENITSRELMSRGKCWYLRGVRGNPFSLGLFGNIAAVINT
jgi:hypothetical protein